jgi:hypothetical protein
VEEGCMAVKFKVENAFIISKIRNLPADPQIY